MDNNEEYNLVYTLKSDYYPNNELIIDEIKSINKRITTVEDIIIDNFIPASSTMFRNIITKIKFPQKFNNFQYGDWPLYILLTISGGKIFCLLEYTTVYRKNEGILNELKRNKIKMLENDYRMFSDIINEGVYTSFEEVLNFKLFSIDIEVMKILNRNKKYLKAFQKFIKYKLKKKYCHKPIFKIYLKSILESFYNI